MGSAHGKANGSYTHGMTYSPTWWSWTGMKARCRRHPSYVGRGITVCRRWEKFENFLADMGERPEGMTLDRKNNEGNYTKRNCRWATVGQQNRNTRATKLNLATAGRIKQLYRDGLFGTQIAALVGISVFLANRVIHGHIWKDA